MVLKSRLRIWEKIKLCVTENIMLMWSLFLGGGLGRQRTTAIFVYWFAGCACNSYCILKPSKRQRTTAIFVYWFAGCACTSCCILKPPKLLQNFYNISVLICKCGHRTLVWHPCSRVLNDKVSLYYIYIYIYIYTHTHTHTHTHTQGVTGGMDQTSGECSLGQTILI